MVKEVFNFNKMNEMERRLGCTFCDEGIFAEMSMDLADYQGKTAPIPNTEFKFYEGDIETLKQTVALVDDEWVQYFDSDTHVFCGYKDGRVVSFCSIDTDADCILSTSGIRVGSIGCVGTIPQYRKNGIGLRMVDLATAYLKNEGCDKSYIHYTHIDDWYAKLGYQTFARFNID